MPDPVEPEPLSIPVAGGTLAAFRYGPGDSDAPLVIAAHGITSSNRAWLPVARALAPRASMVAVDLRGRGRSNALPPPFGMAAHAADLLAVIDELGADRAVVVGHSLGAYIAARLAADHPERVRAVVLVDGGLTIPGSERVDPQAFMEAFLGPALARLKMTFPSRQAYRDWWRRHPAIAGGDIADSDLDAYADYDLVGEPPELRSAVVEAAVRTDAGELFEFGKPAHRLAVPATLLCAPRGLLDDPNPMQPLEVASAWAAEDPEQRRVTVLEDVNHYTITLGGAGAATVADVIAGAASR